MAARYHRLLGPLAMLLAVWLATPALAEDLAALRVEVQKADALLKKCLPEHDAMAKALLTWAKDELEKLKALEAKGELTDRKKAAARAELDRRKNALADKEGAIKKAWSTIIEANKRFGSGGQAASESDSGRQALVQTTRQAIDNANRLDSGIDSVRFGVQGGVSTAITGPDYLDVFESFRTLGGD